MCNIFIFINKILLQIGLILSKICVTPPPFGLSLLRPFGHKATFFHSRKPAVLPTAGFFFAWKTPPLYFIGKTQQQLTNNNINLKNQK